MDYSSLELHAPRPLIGFARHRILLDGEGKPVDYEFLEVNEAFEKLTGLPRESVLGRTAREILPGIKESAFDWISFYGEVALKVEERAFEQYFEPLGRWFRVHVHSGERLFFTTIFLDITRSKRRAEELRYSPVPVPPFEEKGRRVLLVDDNRLEQRVGLRMLRHLGLSADVAENGEEALAAMEKADYDLVLMDCLMPLMDGYEAARRIRAMGGDAGRVPIVAITSQVMIGDREKCIEAGMDDYLAKPFSRVALAAMLGRWLKEAPSPRPSPGETPAAAPAAESVPPERPVWQRDILLNRLGGDRAFLREVAEPFLSEAIKQIASLRCALEEGRCEEAGKIANFIKGDAANMNAVSLEGAAFEMQKALRIGCGESVLPLLERLEYEFHRLDEVVREELSG